MEGKGGEGTNFITRRRDLIGDPLESLIRPHRARKGEGKKMIRRVLPGWFFQNRASKNWVKCFKPTDVDTRFRGTVQLKPLGENGGGERRKKGDLE